MPTIFKTSISKTTTHTFVPSCCQILQFFLFHPFFISCSTKKKHCWFMIWVVYIWYPFLVFKESLCFWFLNLIRLYGGGVNGGSRPDLNWLNIFSSLWIFEICVVLFSDWLSLVGRWWIWEERCWMIGNVDPIDRQSVWVWWWGVV